MVAILEIYLNGVDIVEAHRSLTKKSYYGSQGDANRMERLTNA
jgi:hypothetical protein